MGAHRYWGVYLSPVNPNNRAAVAEVQMRGVAGGANLCTGGTPSGPGGTPGNAFDGNASTWWESPAGSGQAPLWVPRISYQFASPVEIVEMVLTNNNNASMLSAWGVPAWSDDGAAWTPCGPAFALSTAASGSVTVTGFADAQLPAAPAGSVAARLVTEWGTVGAPSGVAQAPGSVARMDPWCGPGSVAGDVAIEGTPAAPVRRRVLLLDRASGQLMREAWSDPTTGAYAFPNVRDADAIVLAIDHTRAYNAVVADAIDPTP